MGRRQRKWGVSQHGEKRPQSPPTTGGREAEKGVGVRLGPRGVAEAERLNHQARGNDHSVGNKGLLTLPSARNQRSVRGKAEAFGVLRGDWGERGGEAV